MLGSTIVKPPPKKKRPEDDLPVKGSNLISRLYCNVFMAGITGSGKTTLLHHILKYTIDKRTKVFIFAKQLKTDDMYELIIDLLNEYKCTYKAYTDVVDKDTGENLLERAIEMSSEDVQQGKGREIQDENKAEEKVIIQPPEASFFRFSTPEEPKPKEMIGEGRKPRKPKYIVPSHIIILDDQDEKYLQRYVYDLAKQSRHVQVRFFVLSQYLKDVKPRARSNIHHYFLYSGFPKKQIVELAEHLSLPIQGEDFYRMYLLATSKQYKSFHIDRFGTPMFYQDFKPIKISKRNLLLNKQDAKSKESGSSGSPG